jgi:uncharacterized protein
MALILEITVVPLSGKSECTLDANGNLKCYLKSAPEKGKANAELVRLLSLKLRIPLSSISVLTGATGRKKRVKIDATIEKEALLQKLLR